LVQYVTDEDSEFYNIEFNLDIQSSGNALSVITMYRYQDVVLGLTLQNKENSEVLAKESEALLDDALDENYQESFSNNFATFIEQPSIEAGQYKLVVHIPKAGFAKTKAFATCLSFDMTVEYVPRRGNGPVEN